MSEELQNKIPKYGVGYRPPHPQQPNHLYDDTYLWLRFGLGKKVWGPSELNTLNCSLI